jgi:hypothetical protein
MRKALLIASLTLLSNAAWSQTRDEESRPSSRSWDYRDGSDHRGWREERGGGQDWERRSGTVMHGGEMRGGQMDGGHMGGGQGSARFRIRSGDASVLVRCGDDEPMKACVEATMMLLDKLRSMPPAPAASSNPSPGSPAAPSPPAPSAPPALR